MIEARPSLRSALVVAIGIAAIFLLVAGASAARGPAKSPAADKAVAGELIVRFTAGTTEAQRERALERAGAKAARSLAKQHTKLARTAKADTAHALKLLRSDPAVEYAEPNYRYHASAERIPNDPSFAQLWGLRNSGQTVNGTTGSADADIDADEAWAVTTGSSDVVVAVIDTGVDFTHPDLAGSQWTNPGESCTGCRTDGLDNDGNGYVDDWRGWDFVNDDNNPFDDEGHGTHVAGTIGAVGDNGVGVTGVAWNARIMALKFLDATGGGSLDDALEAIRYATAMRVPITNNSWGGGFYSQALFDAIEEADAAGSLFVAAAGNDGSDLDVYDSFPASYRVPNIVSVAASDQGDALADFSNYGRGGVDLSAPGTNVYSTIPGGGYDWYAGTSMATPHVAGAAALAKAAHPGATAVGLKSLLLRSVDTPAGLAGKVATDGRLNVATAVSCSAAPRAWIEAPGAGFKSAVGDAVQVVAIGTSCGEPAGATVTATANGEAVQLVARGDGIYTGTYTPTAAGPVSVSATAVTAAGSDTWTVTGVANLNYRVTDGPYAWVDATVGGTKLALGDDTASSVALPFPFRYYGADYSSVKVGSNGLLVFGADPATDYMNGPLPDAFEPNGIVAPYWDDLNPSVTGAGVWYRTVGTAPNRTFVVAWVAVPAYAGGNGVTFEVILEEATKDIVYQYKDVDHGYYEWDWGASATVGVEDSAGEVGRLFSYDSASLQPYQGLKSIRLSIGAGVPPPPPGPDTTPPAPPTGLAATAGNASVELDWADSPEPDLAGYGVELRNGDGSWSPLATVSSSAFTHTGLVNDVAYSYRVVARDIAGNVSAASATVTATPVARATYSPGSYSVVTGWLAGGSLASLAADDGNRLAVDAQKLSRRNFRAALTAIVSLPAERVASLRSLAIAYDGHVSTSGASLRIRVLNQRTGLWETVDGPNTGVTSDRSVSWTAAVPADYVSATGQVRVSAYAESTSDFVQRTDLVSVTIEF